MSPRSRLYFRVGKFKWYSLSLYGLSFSLIIMGMVKMVDLTWVVKSGFFLGKEAILKLFVYTLLWFLLVHCMFVHLRITNIVISGQTNSAGSLARALASSAGE